MPVLFSDARIPIYHRFRISPLVQFCFGAYAVVDLIQNLFAYQSKVVFSVVILSIYCFETVTVVILYFLIIIVIGFHCPEKPL